MQNTMHCEDLKTAIINISTSGDNSLIPAAPTGTYIAVDFVQIIPSAPVTVTFLSGTSAQGQVALTGPYPLSQQQVVTDENVFQHQKGIMTCNDARDFVINLGSAVQCGGFIRYRYVGNQ